jgi:hypothetical protein
MGKKSSYPSYSTGTVTVNGNTVASSAKTGKNTISASYNMSDSEKQIYDSLQSNISSSLSNLFDISDSTKQQWQDVLDSYKSSGIKEIEDIYTPMETSLKNDIASRFGNFDNSIFMDNLNTITDKKAQAIADLSESLTQKQEDLYTNELANRMSYLTLLSGLSSAMDNNMLNYMALAQSASTSGNNYSAQQYQATSNSSLFSSLLSTVGTIGSAAISKYLPTSTSTSTSSTKTS